MSSVGCAHHAGRPTTSAAGWHRDWSWSAFIESLSDDSSGVVVRRISSFVVVVDDLTRRFRHVVRLRRSAASSSRRTTTSEPGENTAARIREVTRSEPSSTSLRTLQTPASSVPPANPRFYRCTARPCVTGPATDSVVDRDGHNERRIRVDRSVAAGHTSPLPARRRKTSSPPGPVWGSSRIRPQSHDRHAVDPPSTSPSAGSASAPWSAAPARRPPCPTSATLPR